MTHLFLSENDEYGIVHLSGNGATLVLDEDLHPSSTKIYIHHGQLTPLSHPHPKERLCLVTKPGAVPTGYLKMKKGEATDYSLMGTGILGVVEKCDSPNLVKKNLLNPLILSTFLHNYFFRKLSIQTLRYVEHGGGDVNRIANAWSVFLPNNKVTPALLKQVTTEWKKSHTTASLTPSPVTLLLRELGYDSIVDWTTHIGISFP